MSALAQNIDKFIGMRIRRIRKSQGISAERLAKMVNVSRPTITRYETGARSISQSMITKIAAALHVMITEFYPKTEDSVFVDKQNHETYFYNPKNGEYDIKLPSNMHYLYQEGQISVRIPIIGTIACGDPITAEQNIDGYTNELFNKRPSGTLFALRCKGDSMEPTIPNGAVVIIHQQPDVEDDEVAAVLVDDDNEATLKRVKHSDGQIMLLPENKKYDPILLNEKNPGRILGKVIRVSFDM